jgi:outer membrane protein assembly factor BamB
MHRSIRAITAAIVGALVVLPTQIAGTADAAPKACNKPESHAQAWSSWGHDLSNSRDQEATPIDASNVASLKPAWAVASTDTGGVGAFESTPVEAGGCVIAATTSGSIYALDADTGQIVWQVYKQSDGGLAGGIFAPAIANGVVYALVGRSGAPYAVALDAATGDQIWEADLYQGLMDGETHLQNVNSSAVVFDGMVFMALAGADGFNYSHPSFFILDAKTGALLKKTAVIPERDWLNYGGGGMWGTAVVDTVEKYLYVGTANPYNKRREHLHTNSMLKIDVDRHRKTFGEIVAAHKGDKDYDPKLYDTPQCKYFGELQLVGFSTFCGQKDVDFGASPSLYTDSKGRTIVVNLQKSCTLHAVFADSMKQLWKHSELGVGGASGCASATAWDDHAVYVKVNDGLIYALNKDTGATLWKTTYRDPGPVYQPVSVANGVVYTVGNTGHLFAFDRMTGKVLLDKALVADGQTCSGTQSAGVSIVGDTVYVECDVVEGSGVSASIVALGGGAVFAYRLPR